MPTRSPDSSNSPTSNPSIPQSPNPSIPQSPNPSIPQSPNPSIPQSPNPSIPQSPNPSIPQSPNPSIPFIKPSVQALTAYTLSALTATRKLNQNESSLDVPEHLKRLILERAAALPWNRYPDFVPGRLVEIIAARHGWDPAGVLVGNGSNEVLQATLSVSVGGGDAVVSPDPSFALYRLITGVMGGRYVPVPLGPEFSVRCGRVGCRGPA